MKQKVLVLGGAGMAGHMITKFLKLYKDKYEIHTTARNNKYIKPTYIIDIEKQLELLKTIINFNDFDYIINCIGILIKEANNNLTKAIYVNSYFPHWLEQITSNTKTKVIHLSTDCIFSGKKGNYTENDIPDETNFYGRSKALGEINNDKDLTIRLSIIGTELKYNGTGLLHWFLSQEGSIGGYSKAYWNGITTLELAKAIHCIIEYKPKLSGLYQLAPDFCIDKYNLLKAANVVFNKKLEIIPNEKVIQNKTLKNTRKDEFNFNIPNYKNQLIMLKSFNEKIK